MIFLTEIYIIRHPEAFGNKERIIQGFSDFDVTEKGEKQLAHLAERFKNIKIDVIYTSPLLRAVKTAEAINKYHNLDIIIENNLIEINCGLLEGKSWQNFEENFKDEYDKWKNQPHLFCAPKGDSMEAVYNRVKTALDKILKENKNKSIAITTHGCAIRNMYCYLLDYPFEKLNDIFWNDNTAVTLVQFNNENKPEFIYQNDISHLPEDIRPIRQLNNSNEYNWGKEVKD